MFGLYMSETIPKNFRAKEQVELEILTFLLVLFWIFFIAGLLEAIFSNFCNFRTKQDILMRFSLTVVNICLFAVALQNTPLAPSERSENAQM